MTTRRRGHPTVLGAKPGKRSLVTLPDPAMEKAIRAMGIGLDGRQSLSLGVIRLYQRLQGAGMTDSAASMKGPH